MPVYSVTYDLRKQGQDYSGLIEKLKSFPSYKYQQSAWLIKTSLTPTDVYNQLESFIDSNDLILVIEVTNNRYGRLLTGSWDSINALFK